jgi:hypothetical protein
MSVSSLARPGLPKKGAGRKILAAYQRGVTPENREDGIRALRKDVGLDAARLRPDTMNTATPSPLDGRILDAGITATVEQELETGRPGKILERDDRLQLINSLGK